MPVPKRKTSKSRRDKRRSHNSKLASPGVILCPNCKEPTQPHRVCAKCGYYKGKKYLAVEEL